MTSFEQILLQEVATLPESRRADVLAFVRHLRLTLAEDAEIEERFDAAFAKVRETAAKYNITEQDIDDEVRAVREARARGA